MHKVISQCPVCKGKLKVVKLQCDNCETTIENAFSLSKFDYLSSEDLYFVETFVKCRGNIKEVEKELKISYPTVRAKLDSVIQKLGYEAVLSNEPQDDSEPQEEMQKQEAAKGTDEYDKKVFHIKISSPLGDIVNLKFPVKAVKKLIQATGKIPMPTADIGQINLADITYTVEECLDAQAMGDLVNVTISEGSALKIFITE